MTISAHDEPVWNLERRESSGDLFWSRQSSKVKFRCDVEVLEYVKHPDEHNDNHYIGDPINTMDKIGNILLIFATCVVALAVTTFLPWLLIWWKLIIFAGIKHLNFYYHGN